MKLSFRDGDIFVPIAKTEFCLRFPGWRIKNTDEVRVWCGLEEDFPDRTSFSITRIGGCLAAREGSAARCCQDLLGRSSGFAVAGLVAGFVDRYLDRGRTFARSAFPGRSASGVRQSELSLNFARLAVWSAGT